jgi:hypothetical protein
MRAAGSLLRALGSTSSRWTQGNGAERPEMNYIGRALCKVIGALRVWDTHFENYRCTIFIKSEEWRVDSTFNHW